MIQKTVFYKELQQVFEHFPKYDMKILLGCFNAKVGAENIFKPITGNESLHQDSSDNGVKIVKLATSKNLAVKSTMSPHTFISTTGPLLMGRHTIRSTIHTGSIWEPPQVLLKKRTTVQPSVRKRTVNSTLVTSSQANMRTKILQHSTTAFSYNLMDSSFEQLKYEVVRTVREFLNSLRVWSAVSRQAHCIVQGSTHFPKIQASPHNSVLRNGSMERVSFRGRTNIKRHRPKFSRPSELAPRIFGRLVFLSIFLFQEVPLLKSARTKQTTNLVKTQACRILNFPRHVGAPPSFVHTELTIAAVIPLLGTRDKSELHRTSTRSNLKREYIKHNTFYEPDRAI